MKRMIVSTNSSANPKAIGEMGGAAGPAWAGFLGLGARYEVGGDGALRRIMRRIVYSMTLAWSWLNT